MKNEIVKVQAQSSLTEIMSIGKAFAESGMFTDCKTAAQAVVKIQAGAEMGIPPFAAMSGIHIIQGKPTVGAGLMAANVKASGKYDYKVVEATEKKCSIDFYQGKEKLGNSTFTIEDAKKALTKNIDKFPKNMLFARAISNGVKWYTPDVFAGPVYTPEEFDNIEPPQQVEAIDITSELSHYIGNLDKLHTVDELKEYKAILPDYIVRDASFIAAGKQRYGVIMAEQA